MMYVDEGRKEAFWKWIQDNFAWINRVTGIGPAGEMPVTKGGVEGYLATPEGQELFSTWEAQYETVSPEEYFERVGEYLEEKVKAGELYYGSMTGFLDYIQGELLAGTPTNVLPFYGEVQQPTWVRRAGEAQVAKGEKAQEAQLKAQERYKGELARFEAQQVERKRVLGVQEAQYAEHVGLQKYLAEREYAPAPTGGPYGGYDKYEDYVAAKGIQEREAVEKWEATTQEEMAWGATREQAEEGAGEKPHYAITPKTAFGKPGMQPLLPALLQEEGIRHFYQRAKELGIDTTGLEMSQYQPGVTDPFETGAHVGLALSVRREEERLRTEKSKRLGADYPEFAGRYQAHMAPTAQEIYRPEPLAGMASWLETLPEFKEAQQKREAEMIGKYPAAWQAYGEAGGPMGWQEWLGQEPAAQKYVEAQELKFTQARQRAQARVAPKARWATYA